MSERVLVDTSVWIDYFRQGDVDLERVLQANTLLTHPFVIGELACGNLKNRSEILTLLQVLPQALLAEPQEVLLFIERYQLMGKGIGYVDMHLLAATTLTDDACLWTRDKRLLQVAQALELNDPNFT